MQRAVPIVLLGLIPLTHLVAPGGVAPRTPAAWIGDPTPPASCGRPIRIVAAIPRPEPPDGELVSLVNPGPGPISLGRFELRAGRRRVRLPPLELRPGAGVTLGPDALGSLRLRNDDGTLSLVDPCGGQTDAVAWGETTPGEVLWAADLGPMPRSLPFPGRTAAPEPISTAATEDGPSPDS